MIDVEEETKRRNPYYKLLSWTTVFVLGLAFWIGFAALGVVLYWMWAL